MARNIFICRNALLSWFINKVYCKLSHDDLSFWSRRIEIRNHHFRQYNYKPLLTLQAVKQLGVANVLICSMAEPLVVPLSPGVHLAVFSEGQGKLAATAHLHYVQVLQFFNKFGCLTAIAASSAQFPVVSIPPGPHLTCRHTGRLQF